MLIPWDQGNSFGWFDVPPWWNTETNVLASKNWNEPEYRARYLGALLQVADAVSADGWLAGEAQRDYQQIRDAVYAGCVSAVSVVTIRTDARDEYSGTIDTRTDAVRQFVASLTQ